MKNTENPPETTESAAATATEKEFTPRVLDWTRELAEHGVRLIGRLKLAPATALYFLDCTEERWTLKGAIMPDDAEPLPVESEVDGKALAEGLLVSWVTTWGPVISPDLIPVPELDDEDAMDVASKLYTHYCAAVGGKAFNGDPLPAWGEFLKDPAKEKQALAWLSLASLVQLWVWRAKPLTPQDFEKVSKAMDGLEASFAATFGPVAVEAGADRYQVRASNGPGHFVYARYAHEMGGKKVVMGSRERGVPFTRAEAEEHLKALLPLFPDAEIVPVPRPKEESAAEKKAPEESTKGPEPEASNAGATTTMEGVPAAGVPG
jgi:hypothetical protein